MRLFKEFHRSLTAIFFLAFSCSAYSENTALTNLYFSAEAGWSAMDHGHVPPYQFKDQKNVGYRLSMGYLFPLSTIFELGPDIGYGYYGKISYKNPTNLIASYESYGWSILANLTSKVTPKIDLILKGGFTEVSQHYDIAGPNVTTGGFYQQEFRPTLILASSYALSKHASIGLSYTHIFANNAPLTSNPQFTFKNVDEICSVNSVMAVFTYSV